MLYNRFVSFSTGFLGWVNQKEEGQCDKGDLILVEIQQVEGGLD